MNPGVHGNLEGYRQLLLAGRSLLLPKSPVKFDLLARLGHLPAEDQAALLHEEFVSIRLTGLERRRLGQIDAALERMEGGVYGLCIECRGPISHRRLQALPWAGRCIGCEERIGAGPDPCEFSSRAA